MKHAAFQEKISQKNGARPRELAVDPLKGAPKHKGCRQPFWVLNGKPCHRDTTDAVKISCGKCFPCVMVKKQMLIGRLAGQAVSSDHTIFVTLTYRDNADGSTPYNATALIKDDVELFKRTMRNRYGTFEYLIAGEYGERKRRAHWHGLLYFTKALRVPNWFELPPIVEWEYKMAKMRYRLAPKGSTVEHCGKLVDATGSFPVKIGGNTYTVFPPSRSGNPGVPARFRVLVPEWPHGHIDVCIPTSGAFGYVAKYVLKAEDAKVLHHNGASSLAPQEDEDGKRINYFTKSRRLGLDYIKSVGVDHALQGHQPKDSLYRVGDIKYKNGPKKGKYVPFTMTRAQRREYIRAFLRETARQLVAGKKKEFEPQTEFLLNFIDRDTDGDPTFGAHRFSIALAARFTSTSVRSRLNAAVTAKKVSELEPEERRHQSFPFASKQYDDISAKFFRDGVIEIEEKGDIDVFPWLLSLNGPDLERQFDALPFYVSPAARSDIANHGRALLADFKANAPVTERRVREDVEANLKRLARFNRQSVDKVVSEWTAAVCPLPADYGGDIPPRAYGLPVFWRGGDFTPTDKERFPLWCFFLKEAHALGHGP